MDGALKDSAFFAHALQHGLRSADGAAHHFLQHYLPGTDVIEIGYSLTDACGSTATLAISVPGDCACRKSSFRSSSTCRLLASDGEAIPRDCSSACVG
jgi:hypothetical protein